MSDLQKLQQALGITPEQPRVMTVVSVDDGKSRLEANGAVVVVSGVWAVGSQLVVRAGNVESIVASTVAVLYID
jgi:hypothetical protein